MWALWRRDFRNGSGAVLAGTSADPQLIPQQRTKSCSTDFGKSVPGGDISVEAPWTEGPNINLRRLAGDDLGYRLARLGCAGHADVTVTKGIHDIACPTRRADN